MFPSNMARYGVQMRLDRESTRNIWDDIEIFEKFDQVGIDCRSIGPVDGLMAGRKGRT